MLSARADFDQWPSHLTPPSRWVEGPAAVDQLPVPKVSDALRFISHWIRFRLVLLSISLAFPLRFLLLFLR